MDDYVSKAVNKHGLYATAEGWTGEDGNVRDRYLCS